MNLNNNALLGQLAVHGGTDTPRHELLAMAWIAGQRSKATRRGYGGNIRRWFAWLESNGIDPLEVQRFHVELFQRSLEQNGRKPATIALYLTCISSFYAYCVDEDVLAKNPVDKVKRPSSSERISKRNWLTRPQLHDLIEGAKMLGHTEHALICLLGLNGVRIAEACGLDVEDVQVFGDYKGVEFIRKGGRVGKAIFARRTEQRVERRAHLVAVTGCGHVAVVAVSVLGGVGHWLVLAVVASRRCHSRSLPPQRMNRRRRCCMVRVTARSSAETTRASDARQVPNCGGSSLDRSMTPPSSTR